MYTSGPWEVALDSRNKAVIVHHKGKSIATVRGKNAENDAILISAATEMFRALLHAEQIVRISNSRYAPETAPWNKELKQIRDALAKVKGLSNEETYSS